jgi:hypothetical protein
VEWYPELQPSWKRYCLPPLAPWIVIILFKIQNHVDINFTGKSRLLDWLFSLEESCMYFWTTGAVLYYSLLSIVWSSWPKDEACGAEVVCLDIHSAVVLAILQPYVSIPTPEDSVLATRKATNDWHSAVLQLRLNWSFRQIRSGLMNLGDPNLCHGLSVFGFCCKTC